MFPVTLIKKKTRKPCTFRDMRPESVETRRLLTNRNIELNHWALRFARAHLQLD